MGHFCTFYDDGYEYGWGNPPYDPWRVLFEQTGNHPPGRVEDMEPLTEAEATCTTFNEADARMFSDRAEYEEEIRSYLQDLAWRGQPTEGRIPRFKFASHDTAWVRVDEISASLAAVDALTPDERKRMNAELGEWVGGFWAFVSFLREAAKRGGFWAG